MVHKNLTRMVLVHIRSLAILSKNSIKTIATIRFHVPYTQWLINSFYHKTRSTERNLTVSEKRTTIKTTTKEKYLFLDTKIPLASIHLKRKMYSNIPLSKEVV